MSGVPVSSSTQRRAPGVQAEIARICTRLDKLEGRADFRVIEESLGAENLKRQGKEVDGDISCMKLYEAVKDLDLPLVKAYIASGFNVNVRIHNSTPLRWAVDIGHVPMVEALLHAGANFNAKDDLGYTPLHCASRNGDIKIVEILLSWGANKNLRTSKGLARELIPDNGFVPTTKKLFDLLS